MDVVVRFDAIKKPLPHGRGCRLVRYGYRLPPPGQVCSGGRSPILMRSEPPPLVMLEDSDSLPIPMPPPSPAMPIDPISSGSAGRATGRLAPMEGCAAFGELLPPVRFTAERLPSSRPAFFSVVLVRLRPLVFELLDFVLLDFALVALLRLLPPRFPRVFAARFAVIRLPLDDFVVERFDVDFFVEDFFFAAMCPPFGCATNRAA
jgi:hypothetical protein